MQAELTNAGQQLAGKRLHMSSLDLGSFFVSHPQALGLSTYWIITMYAPLAIVRVLNADGQRDMSRNLLAGLPNVQYEAAKRVLRPIDLAQYRTRTHYGADRPIDEDSQEKRLHLILWEDTVKMLAEDREFHDAAMAWKDTTCGFGWFSNRYHCYGPQSPAVQVPNASHPSSNGTTTSVKAAIAPTPIGRQNAAPSMIQPVVISELSNNGSIPSPIALDASTTSDAVNRSLSSNSGSSVRQSLELLARGKRSPTKSCGDCGRNFGPAAR